MAKASNDVSRIICANTVQENEKRLIEARIKNQGKSRAKQDLSKLFHRLNQVRVKENTLKSSEKLSCYNKNVTNCWYGPISEFPSGSWWGIRMDCSRDRIHDPFNADVAEGPFGVASACTSYTNMREDVDFGNFLTLTGELYREGQPSTDAFICNYKNQIPLRLIRSYNLQDDIAPNTGYRYDGLYVVIGYWIGADADGNKYNKFALMRLADQEPPSWSNKSSETLSSTRYCISSTRQSHSKPYSSSNAYDLRKCSYNSDIVSGKEKLSHKDGNEILPTVKVISSTDARKSTPEISIVTRHVSKKPRNSESTMYSTSVPDRNTLTCLGTSTSKTHSTNISIRMGLYDSSHNVQETKKNVSTMLHKPFKPFDLANRTTPLDAEGAHSSTREDNKLITRINANKAPDNSQPIGTISCNGHIAASNATVIKEPPLDTHSQKLYSHIMYPSEHPYVISSPLSGSDNNVNAAKCKEQFRDAPRSTNVSINRKLSLDKGPQTNAIAAHDNKLTSETSETPHETLCAQNIKSLDSLTPDKILKLINKEKHHPLSKLLIGNVIGLTTEECAMLNTKTSDVSSKINHKQRDNIKENVACLSDDMLNRRYCRYSKSKRLSWKVTKTQTDAGTFDTTLVRQQSCNDAKQNCNGNGKMKDQSSIPKKENKDYLSPFNVQAPLQAITQHTRSTYNIRTRLRADKGVVLVKQEFSTSPIKKNRYKKWDREIANLLIDANIGPLTRGPRNRKLRCTNNMYTNKRCYSTFNAVVYPHGKRSRITTEKQRYKSSFNRKSKLTKVTRQSVRDKQNKDSRYRVSNALQTTKSNNKNIEGTMKKEKHFEAATNNNNNDRNYNNNNESDRKKERRIDADADDTRNISKTSFDRCLRKKLTQTIPLSRRAPQTSRLHYFHKKQVPEKPSTMDATTQCKLIFEEPIESVLEEEGEDPEESTLYAQTADQRAIIKIEWNKSEKMELQSAQDDAAFHEQNSQIYEISRLCPTSAVTVDNGHCTNASVSSLRRTRSEKSLEDRVSAFVPVNAFDSDLRIARLRSLGFKPIIKPRSPHVANEWIVQSNRKDAHVGTSRVTKRNVAEEYDKYTNNEDNSVVVYMDDELQYQDIEQEEDESALGRERAMRSTLKDVQADDDTVLLEARDNLESPWHGWKKIVANNQSYWIGW